MLKIEWIILTIIFKGFSCISLYNLNLKTFHVHHKLLIFKFYILNFVCGNCLDVEIESYCS